MQSDLRIPRTSDILDRAADERERAERLNDKAAYDQFGRLIERLPGARLCWVLGTLHIDSTSGNTYHVTRAGCSCLNGTKSNTQACYHWALFNLLLDMLDTLAESADMDADERPVAPRIVACRSIIWGAL